MTKLQRYLAFGSALIGALSVIAFVWAFYALAVTRRADFYLLIVPAFFTIIALLAMVEVWREIFTDRD